VGRDREYTAAAITMAAAMTAAAIRVSILVSSLRSADGWRRTGLRCCCQGRGSGPTAARWKVDAERVTSPCSVLLAIRVLLTMLGRRCLAPVGTAGRGWTGMHGAGAGFGSAWKAGGSIASGAGSSLAGS
jgi:hypothetical protein